MKQTIIEADLDAAIAAVECKDNFTPWTSKCLMAQFARRVTGKDIDGSTSTAAAFVGEDGYNFAVDGAQHLVSIFDAIKTRPDYINRIREQLPLEVEVSIIS